MEIYNSLFTIPADEIEPGDLIEFKFLDDDGEIVNESVLVTETDVENEGTTIIGTSQNLELGDTVTYILANDTEVTVLGG